VKASKQNPAMAVVNHIEYIKGQEIMLKNLKRNLTIDLTVAKCVDELSNIMVRLDSFQYLFKKMNLEEFSDKFKFLGHMHATIPFAKSEALVLQYIDYANAVEIYNNNRKMIEEVSIKCREFESKADFVNEITKDIADLSANVAMANTNIDENNKFISIKIEELDNLNTLRGRFEALIKNIMMSETIVANINKADLELRELEADMQSILTAEKELFECGNILEASNANLTPLISDRDKLKHALSLVEEYCVELEEYKQKYEKIENIKFYTSPTTGIQTIFMESYMNKIIHMANQLLALLFEGEYVLQPFIINENEFRIPCLGKGFMNDDISSMSTSQICMISMILSFALLYHSSSKYNILKLDEIDGGLDVNNRLQFIGLLNKQMEILKCQQAIMISHNSEASLENVDLIILRKSDPTFRPSGNVIYNYSNG